MRRGRRVDQINVVDGFGPSSSCFSHLGEMDQFLNCFAHQLSHFEVIKERQTKFQKQASQHCNPGNGHVLAREKGLKRKWFDSIDTPGRFCVWVSCVKL